LKLKKQYEILENSKKSNMKKYGTIISLNEKNIYDLNQEKTKLMRELQRQLKINDKLGTKINELYGINETNDNNWGMSKNLSYIDMFYYNGHLAFYVLKEGDIIISEVRRNNNNSVMSCRQVFLTATAE
jgi:predicted RNase H-like nuclease (RuvC/YqgF family)